MSIAITSRPPILVALTQARPVPPVIPGPQEQAGSSASPASGASQSTPPASDQVNFGATLDPDLAQDSPGEAQEGADVGPNRSTGFQDGERLFGDLTGDRVVDGQDITMLLQAFNDSVSLADLNGDGSVNTADLGLLINAIRDFNNRNNAESASSQSQSQSQNQDPARVIPLSSIPLPGDGKPETKTTGRVERGPIAQPLPNESGGPTAQSGLVGDLTGDGVVDAADLDLLKLAFGKTQAEGDLNGDGRVDSADLGKMIGILNQ